MSLKAGVDAFGGNKNKLKWALRGVYKNPGNISSRIDHNQLGTSFGIISMSSHLTFKKITTVIFLLVAALVLNSCAEITPLEKGTQYARSMRWEDSVREFLPLAQTGDARAQYALGKVYIDRKDIKVAKSTPEEGVAWINKSAAQGYAPAESELGELYYLGKIVRRDLTEAMKWYRKAADQGHARAEAMVGVMYANAKGVPRDGAMAAQWFKRSAEQGYPLAQLWLGEMYADGSGVEKDDAQAELWIRKAVDNRNNIARYELAFFYEDKNPPDLVRASNLLSNAKVDSAQAAQLQLARFYARGTIDSDVITAMSWRYRRSGQNDDQVNKWISSFFKVFPIMEHRWADPERAIAYYQAAVSAGNLHAMVELSSLYWYSRGRYRNCGEAFTLAKTAANKGDPSAQLLLGRMYQEGPDNEVVRMGAVIDDTSGGIKVIKVISGEVADKAGLLEGDVVQMVDETAAENIGKHGLIQLVKRSEGKTVTLTIKREGSDKLQQVSIMPVKTTVHCPGAEEKELKKNPVESVNWFKKAAENGNSSGEFFLAEAYRDGVGVSQDYQKALQLFRKLVDNDDWEAAQAISHMYASGQGVPQSREESERWYRRALELKHKSIRR